MTDIAKPDIAKPDIAKPDTVKPDTAAPAVPAAPAAPGHPPRVGPGAPAGWDWPGWAAALGGPDATGPLLACRGGFDVGWERQALAWARNADRPLLSVRITASETLIGPLWTPGGSTGCAGCAQAASLYLRWEPEERFGHDRAERERLEASGSATPPPAGSGTAAAFPPWLGDAVGALATDRHHGIRDTGGLIAVSATGTVTRHRVSRTFRCRVCGDPAPRLLITPSDPPPKARRTVSRPTGAAVPTRGEHPPFALDPERMRAALADPRFGPITRMTRHSAGTYPISETELLVGTPAGMGRAATFREAEAVAVLEAYERMAGYPHGAAILPATSRRTLGDLALDPMTLGHYTERQLASPHSRLRPYHQDAELDWVWSQPLGGGEPLLVPAEIGFFRYRYDLRPPSARERDDPATPPGPRRNFFLDSSSGSALGATYEEASLHALFELAERDAFLLAWHRARPLPRIDPAVIRDPDSRMMLRLAEERGYDVHLLVATDRIPVPAVWALAIRRDRMIPASFSTAGCHPDPEEAVRAALWELTQMVSAGLVWDPAEYAHTIDDPWPIQTIAEHWRRSTFPELLPRIERVLGGPDVTLEEAFPDWPHALVRAAAGDVRGALEFTAELFRQAGLDRILVVDQSTPEHTAHGMSAVKAVVPGIVPMCFGHAQQRLAGLGRLLDTLGAPEADIPFDPHPFP
ncbi:TOMM precursor leader peptide-binding protein [Peterkaempfera bronchialis]|uniref:TOMM precursor leader peptide-binding protein n=1 Tax=Peterkaempfera bronchialis TaxID=2126346 RepID=UPI003C305413